MDRILWIDLEMTGLNPETEVIIETAAIITEGAPHFTELDQYHCVVRQHQEYLDKMDKWNSKVHRASGLYDQIPTGKTQKEAEDGLVQIVEKYFKEPAIIAGNSIAQDRSFIKKYLLNLESKLHYRMLDVSAWKLILEKEGLFFEKKNQHRALCDIRESIAEMKFYLQYLDRNKITKDKNLSS